MSEFYDKIRKELLKPQEDKIEDFINELKTNIDVDNEEITALNVDCFECDKKADHMHHVIPKSLGGTRTIPLCVICHGKVHGFKISSSLIRIGLEKAKLRGSVFGRPSVPAHKQMQVVQLRMQGVSMRDIAKRCSLGKSTVERIINQQFKKELTNV